MSLMDQIAEMTEDEQNELLNTEFPEELEKEAAAEAAHADLADTLYAYGALMMEREVESHGDLSKEAAEDFDAHHEEITSALESALNDSGILESDDTVGLHKEAQAAAALIFQGYSDQFEKIAAKAKNSPSLRKRVGSFLSAKRKQIGEAASKGAKYVKKHPGRSGAAAAGVGGAVAGGAYLYRRHKNMNKHASEMTYEDLRADIMEDNAIDTVVSEGIEKLAAKGAGKAGLLGRGLKASKKFVGKHYASGKAHVGRHPGRYGLAAGGAAGLGAGFAAGRHSNEKRRRR